MDVYDEDVTERVHVVNEALRAVAFNRPGKLVVCVGNTEEHTATGAVSLAGLVRDQCRYHVDLYNSERGAWEPECSREEGSDLVRVALMLEAQGFRVLRLREA